MNGKHRGRVRLYRGPGRGNMVDQHSRAVYVVDSYLLLIYCMDAGGLCLMNYFVLLLWHRRRRDSVEIHGCNSA